MWSWDRLRVAAQNPVSSYLIPAGLVYVAGQVMIWRTFARRRRKGE